ncbi:GNAT family N-acetyltransferase [Micromonospora robiginosa]|uniref:GNAT family N-acetyltransferase n=1 Tax=Micromonospora robiginosa TaxID=2749844 RepID=A0A7L6B9G4_9ACTN|nr:GNAT family N-acetyltransferase [Micromonospora ferruginea]QLQ38479.1 GNAT family N-acetyltransferase [Micromonospora ferruginea]
MTTVVPVVPDHPAFDQVAGLFDAYRVHYGQPSSPARTASWLRDQLAQHRLAAAAAIRGDQVCGFITVATMPASLRLGTAWSIRDLYVAADHRRTGVARALLHHAILGARVAGARRVSLQTETDNSPALKLYTAIGFTPVAGLDLLNLTLDPLPRDPRDTA